jgi:metallo-beta-lactamase class B
LKELTGAAVAMGEQDIETVQLGTPLTCAEHWYGIDYFETFCVDRPLHHMDSIDLGDTVICCHHTPGHTPGTITYTFDVEVEGKTLTAALWGGPGIWTLMDEHRESQGYFGNRQDYQDSLRYLQTLDVQIWLGAHPFQNDTYGKHRQLREGKTPHPFIDPRGWKDFLKSHELDFIKIISSPGNYS